MNFLMLKQSLTFLLPLGNAYTKSTMHDQNSRMLLMMQWTYAHSLKSMYPWQWWDTKGQSSAQGIHSWNAIKMFSFRRNLSQDKTVDIPPSSQPDRALSALNYGLTPNCNLYQSRYGCTPIACAHTTGNSNTHLSRVSYRNLLRSQYKQGCNQCEHSHTQVYQNLNTHQLHLNAPYKHLSASVSTSPVERTN
jgi:hypothetical protein